MTKEELRQEAWRELREAGGDRFPGVEGRIPNFTGAEGAAERLSRLDRWKAAKRIKANPDSPQWPVRTTALQHGKTVYMAVPKLADPKPFWVLDPDRLEVEPRRASSIKGASQHARPVAVEEMERVDLIVCGSVAVDRSGARLGKGGGYSDLEFAIGLEAGLVGDWTVTVTTVHPAQVMEDGRIPMTTHDFPVDLIVTPDEVIETGTALDRPPGLLWQELDQERLEAIPLLREWRARKP